MKVSRYFVFFLFSILFLGCRDKNTAFEDDERIVHQAYIWTDLENIKSEYGNPVSVTFDENDNVILITEKAILRSDDRGNSFEYIRSNQFNNIYIKSLQTSDQFYARASVKDTLWYDEETDEVGYTLKNAIYSSKDLIIWKIVRGKFIMYDHLFDPERSMLHIARQHGVLSRNIETGEEFDNKFLYSGLDDQITDILLHPSGVLYAASHDGIYESLDDGATWDKSFPEISKDVDAVRSLNYKSGYIVGAGFNGQLEYGNSFFNDDNIHYLRDGENEWNHFFARKRELDEESQLTINSFEVDEYSRMIASNEDGIYIAPIQDEQPYFILVGTFDEESDPDDEPTIYGVKAFSDGDLLLISTKGFKYGERIPGFEYPEF